MIKTVFFDLDDTIFDYRYSRWCAFEALRAADKRIGLIPTASLETAHRHLLEGDYKQVLAGDPAKGMTFLRKRALFAGFGIALKDDELTEIVGIYRRVYRENRRATPGITELMETLKRSARIGIISNGFREYQLEKLMACGVDKLVDYSIFSEDVKSRKPDRRIFELALTACGAAPDEAAFIGDAWETDIIGSRNMGIRAVWFNRYGKECPDPESVYEVSDFYDTPGIFSYIGIEPAND